MSALEGEVSRLERGELPLEAAIEAFTRGMALADKGTAALDTAEKKVELLLSARDGQAKTEPFDPVD